MTYLAYLDLAVNKRSPAPTFERLASDAGCPVRSYDGPISIESIDHFLSESQGLLLFTDTFLLDPTIESSIHAAISNGKRALVRADVNHLDHCNRFLERYGIEGTSIGAFLREPKTEHPRIIPLQRSRNPRSFALPDLLDGINDVALQQPQVLRLDDRALPVVNLPLDIIELTDLRTDFFADWPTSAVSVLALSDSDFSRRGGILAITPTFWHEPYVGPTGVRFPGVSYGDNAILTRNIIGWLIQERLPPQSHELEAYPLINEIERCLARIVTRVLAQAYGMDWWNGPGVPSKIRKSTERRSEREHGYLPARSYLGLNDFRSIVEGSWQLYAAPFRAGEFVGEPSQALSWYASLEDIRNRTMHPAKQLLSGAVISPSNVAFLVVLRDRLRLVLAACSRPA